MRKNTKILPTINTRYLAGQWLTSVSDFEILFAIAQKYKHPFRR